jgi:hydroxymethylpyrimidine pyrophosphatase-like HAD family hydrolase
MIRPKTIFCDIDGTLIDHEYPTITSKKSFSPQVINGTLEKLNEWDKKGYKIILVTARRKSMRKITKRQLSELGIFYDKLIMGIGSGERILINDRKPDGTNTCTAINLDRNEGISNVNV